MERTLNEYSQQEVSLKSELSGMQKRIDERLLVNWEAKVMEFLTDLQAGIQALSDLSVNEEEWLESFDLKKTDRGIAGGAGDDGCSPTVDGDHPSRANSFTIYDRV